MSFRPGFATVIAAVLASQGASAADYYFCDTTRTYYPAAQTCPVPWRKVVMPTTYQPPAPPDLAAPSAPPSVGQAPRPQPTPPVPTPRDTEPTVEVNAGEALPAILSMMGSAAILRRTGQLYSLDIVVDKISSFQKIDSMQSIGLINPELNKTFFQLHTHVFLFKVASLAGAAAIESTYKNTAAEELYVNVYYRENDDFGHATHRPIYALQFTRALNDRINWSGFDDSKLPKVARSFRIDSRFEAELRDEGL